MRVVVLVVTARALNTFRLFLEVFCVLETLISKNFFEEADNGSDNIAASGFCLGGRGQSSRAPAGLVLRGAATPTHTHTHTRINRLCPGLTFVASDSK